MPQLSKSSIERLQREIEERATWHSTIRTKEELRNELVSKGNNPKDVDLFIHIHGISEIEGDMFPAMVAMFDCWKVVHNSAPIKKLFEAADAVKDFYAENFGVEDENGEAKPTDLSAFEVKGISLDIGSTSNQFLKYDIDIERKLCLPDPNALAKPSLMSFIAPTDTDENEEVEEETEEIVVLPSKKLIKEVVTNHIANIPDSSIFKHYHNRLVAEFAGKRVIVKTKVEELTEEETINIIGSFLHFAEFWDNEGLKEVWRTIAKHLTKSRTDEIDSIVVNVGDKSIEIEHDIVFGANLRKKTNDNGED